MSTNLSITARVLGTRNPGTGSKKRIRNIDWPTNQRIEETVRRGDPPNQPNSIIQGVYVLRIIERARSSINGLTIAVLT